MNIYNLYNTEAQFKNYLIAGKISTVSVRNYLSDFRYFCGWFQKIVGDDNIHESLRDKVKVFSAYQRYLDSSDSPIKTKKRRLSTLRKYYDFLVDEKLIPQRAPDVVELLPSPSEAKPEEYSHVLSSFKYELLLKEDSIETEKVVKTINELLSFFQSN
jgi:site-specific recombinase XerD